jgi:hypothetical protein
MGQLLRIFHFPRTQNLFPRTTNVNRDTGNKSYYVYRGNKSYYVFFYCIITILYHANTIVYL